jgi:hypothetical protein
MAYCGACGNEKAYHVQIKFTKKDGKLESCDRCGASSLPANYDVYLGTKGGIQREENLADPETGHPIPYTTKAEKAAIMKRLGLKESGDKVGGARNINKRRTYFI